MSLTLPYKTKVFLTPPKDFNSKLTAAGCYIHFNDKYLFLHSSKGKEQENTER